ncbi:hypothetical protein [Nissabacter archeti]|uniref:hypothetical protein n=1 Tax=Nissabacter archeti TaxID=1917880 RepID=UPI0009A20479|nr:hypothetical protein [Nissabacter archeti]
MNKTDFEQSVTLITLEAGAQGLYVRGEFVQCAEIDEPGLLELANSLGKALGIACIQVDAPEPEDEEWAWNDVVEAWQHPRTTRAQMVIIVTRLAGSGAVHFCGHELLSGCNNDLWFPLRDDKPLFEQIQHIMYVNHIAHNVADIQKVRACGESVDYQVIYKKA